MNISKTEQIILNILWDKHPLSVSAVIENVTKTQHWHDNTIKTLLTRLVKKGALKRFKQDKKFVYEPLISRDEIISKESEGFLDQFFGGKMAPLVAHFAQHKKLSKKEIQDIKKILEDMEKNDD
ncbi:MAG: BlaI/MecI/CopY family transcriptional regulator [Saccharospirillaceae bacterium]|nr:BlaI/MecI/CopY family transcriptional regulator [Pseudomonadales bacterium]NRB80694.1 BlaI/MecI/CopY family transcriptional regulator [Saccharospirillaceae bacterium]